MKWCFSLPFLPASSLTSACTWRTWKMIQIPERRAFIQSPSQSTSACLKHINCSISSMENTFIHSFLSFPVKCEFSFYFVAMHEFQFSQVKNAKQKLTHTQQQKKMAAIKITENDKIALCTISQFKIGRLSISLTSNIKFYMCPHRSSACPFHLVRNVQCLCLSWKLGKISIHRNARTGSTGHTLECAVVSRQYRRIWATTR